MASEGDGGAEFRKSRILAKRLLGETAPFENEKRVRDVPGHNANPRVVEHDKSELKLKKIPMTRCPAQDGCPGVLLKTLSEQAHEPAAVQYAAD
jgi:hypothetical protein